MIGAHSFQVYLDDKKILDQYVMENMEVPTVQVDAGRNSRQLIIKYSECGRTVTGRMITIKDDKEMALKNWRFEGETSGYKDPMVCEVKDIIALKQKGNSTFKVYYSSKEFPEGQQITSLVIGGEVNTARRQ